MIKAIIVDDEINAIKSLRWEIERFCSGIEICDSFTDPNEAIHAINYLKPDCLFLDIEMPKMDGFQLLKGLNYRDFDLIITTAYDNYAIKAFKESAIDYLLKPIDTDDLLKSIDRVKKNKEKNVLGTELKKALEGISSPNFKSKLSLSLSNKMVYVNEDEIIYCKSDGNYTEVHMIGGKKEVLSKKLKDVQELIKTKSFFRVHNSYLVNINFIKEFIKNDGQYLILEQGISIPVSRSRKQSLLELLK